MDPDQIKDVAGKTCRYRGECPLALKAVGQFAETRQRRERGYAGGYTAVTDMLRQIRPAPLPRFEVRFETPPGEQAQVDFAQFQLQFTDEPAVTRIVWLFSFVLGFSRLIWGRFVLHQDMQTLMRCHMAAFEAIGGVPNEILYDRMKTAVIGEAGGSIVYNRALVDFARHYGYQPGQCAGGHRHFVRRGTDAAREEKPRLRTRGFSFG